ncbi:MAG: tyrosine-type recombinase/integrase [Candidatus Margulisiibacteriota bacterium]|jgi:energy-coupling factor transporter ATP-binding protein EcfA2
MPGNVEYLTSNEINALLSAIDDTRDLAIVLLFLNTGIFLNELVSLKTDSINWEKKILAVAGNRGREIQLNDQLFEALAKWSKVRVNTQITALFTTTKGEVNALSARTVDHLIRKYAAQAGIGKKVNAKMLRHTFAARLCREEVSIDRAAAILGITDAESISRYIKVAKEPPKVNLVPEEVDTRPILVKFLTKLFPTKPKIAKPLTTIKGAILPSPTEVAFGREGVIEDIKGHLKKGQSVLLTGQVGIGKTHLLKNIAGSFGATTFYFSSPSPMRDLLKQLHEKLNCPGDKLNGRSSSKEIVGQITSALEAPKTILIIDNLDSLKASDIETFLTLLEKFTILGAVEEPKPKLKSVWWKFKRIDLKPLSEEAAKELIRYLTQNLSITDYEMLETRILSLSNHLPVAIVDMIHQVSHRPVVNKEVIRDVYHEAGVYFRDWTPVIIILWGMVIAFRFVALGMHSFEGYILAGFGTALLATVRVFMFKMK